MPAFLAGVTRTDDELDVAISRSSGLVTTKEDLFFRDSRGRIWITPQGTESDGTSVPRPLWSLIGHSLEGRALPGGVTHDGGYQLGARLTVGPDDLAAALVAHGVEDAARLPVGVLVALPRVTVPATRAEVDRFALYEPFVASGITKVRAGAAYAGVRVGGWRPWGRHARRRASISLEAFLRGA